MQLIMDSSQRVTYRQAAMRNGTDVVSTLRNRNPELMQLPDTTEHDKELKRLRSDVQKKEAGERASLQLAKSQLMAGQASGSARQASKLSATSCS